MRSNTRWALFLLIPLLGALPACKGKAANAEGTPADSSEASEGSTGSKVSLPVVGSEVRQGDLILSINTTGQVRSQGIANLKSETNGTVARVLVQPGQKVSRGQALVMLDPRPFDLAVREAEAGVAEAKVKYVDYVVDFIPAGKSVEEAEIPAERQTNARVRSGLATAELRLERAKLDRERAVIEAPFAGVVDKVEVAQGERVSSGANIATVVDISDLRVEAAVLEHDLPLLTVGGDASVTSPASGSVHGSIAAILPLVDSTTRAGRAVVRVPATAAAMFRPGMYADVRLEASRLPDRILVPTRAVVEREGRPLVFVVKEGKAKWTYVTPGRTNGTDTEILADSVTGQIPVAVGDTVLIEGHLTLTHDAPVRMVARRE